MRSMQQIELTSGDSETVPGLLTMAAGDTRSPGVLLLHGFNSRKERMADSIGSALERRGVSSLAIDLPLHGSREGDIETMTFTNPLALVAKWRLALREADDSLAFLAAHPKIDPARIAVAGYSLGAFLALSAAASSELVRAVALAAGGDLPQRTPFAALVRTIADPLRDAQRLTGRPLFMINGRHDRMVRPEQARALFEAAGEPKELRWYEGGHWPPQSAIDDCASWLVAKLRAPLRQVRLA